MAALLAQQPIIEVRNVSIHFGGISALTDVSFDVWPGEVVALVGDNGAGKSTLIKIISGVQTPSAGEVLCGEERTSIRTAHGAAAAGIQTVYQDLAICDNLDTVQNLFLGRELRRPWYSGNRLNRPKMEAEARRVLSSLDVKIKDPAVPASSLSGGQRQSVAICRSILTDPKVVVLDEPTAALGVAQRRQVLGLIERLREQGRGVIVVSHDLGDVQQVADRVVVLRLGRKVVEVVRGCYSREDLVSAITGVMNDQQLKAEKDQST
ncbi:ATP-binding cassette domain-containing protein [Mesorhizobium sp. VK24D]|uniref:ATP-binding cassette domain-containing protein n=1 Tax=Mesorhizobium album TaxID=3072314 RepID=A0ABU4Y9H7_9HYPH|nr:ATP-binding cassette domain-containing protein [Mesorhizobium sp. VK24D]MDX8482542.1 ATP-binding cassette domain-containing protein [Mesorhizobium sp. VK24D]